MHVQRALEQLGYPHNEIKAYLALLKLGEGTVADVSRTADLPRSTAQLVIEELQKKGLVTHCAKQTHSVWLAESPSRFLNELHDKEALIHKLLPELQSLRHEAKLKPLFKYFTGTASVQNIFDEVLQSKYPIQITCSVSHMQQYLDEDRVQDFFRELFSRRAQIELLTSDSEFVHVLKSLIKDTAHKIRTYEDERLHRVVYILFDNHVALILLSPNESIGIIFDNAGLADSQALIFKHLWDDASPQ
jgi:sugar-specific transcriptional regulator TrmB